MKLLEALEILKRPVVESAATRKIWLLCGFTPLHLQTFLSAHLSLGLPTSLVDIKTGLYGDLAANLERLPAVNGGTACIVVEWSDLDPRLGIRSLGSWDSEEITDIVESARRQTERLAHLIRRAAEAMPVYVSMPTLPFPPLFVTPWSQAQHDELKLREMAAALAVLVSTSSRARIINPQRLDEVSPLCRRFDAKSELSGGFPYTTEHASSLAELFAALIRDVPPRKGIITDLDDTLWGGVLGEDGIEGISWDMTSGNHIHGLYQRLLSSLASSGVLVAVASKNDPALVDKALERKDILLSKDKLFPIEAHWGVKSRSVERILKRWNITPDDAVFIDDSPLEVAEVQSFFPQMECIVFPRSDNVAAWELFKQLRNRFGKGALSAEDKIRLNSIRNAETFHESGRTSEPRTDNFLRDAEARITFSTKLDVDDYRAFELINKANQFNLNGKRLDQWEWVRQLQDPDAFLVTATYEDKYGPLGKVAVVMGKTCGERFHVASWVMSCRAFSRRIEHQCLKYLFEKMGAEEIFFEYLPTRRNGALQDFLEELLGKLASPGLTLSRTAFCANVPALFHRVLEVTDN